MVSVYHMRMRYQAIISAPFAKIGIRCNDALLLGVDFLPPNVPELNPQNKISASLCHQICNYLENPTSQFSVGLKPAGTPHQIKVWQEIAAIPAGYTRSYGELASILNSSAQAVGQACGANAFPIIIPCHRVVGKKSIGGFMNQAGGSSIDIKRWLLEHERR